jgi:hypothetical protein
MHRRTDKWINKENGYSLKNNKYVILEMWEIMFQITNLLEELLSHTHEYNYMYLGGVRL